VPPEKVKKTFGPISTVTKRIKPGFVKHYPQFNPIINMAKKMVIADSSVKFIDDLIFNVATVQL
jgi:hypothetical protein